MAFFCEDHRGNALEFCLCAQPPMYLCADCLSKHKGKPDHDQFSMANFELYKALGNDKAKLVRRIETVKKCTDFLDNASAREAAVISEANNLMADLVRCYQGWLENNHRCFTNLVKVLREEVDLLLTAPKMMLSPLSQMLVNRSRSLSDKEENLLFAIPEEKSLKEIVEHCNQALMKARQVLQQEYENEVQQAFMNLPQEVKASEKRTRAWVKNTKEAETPTLRTKEEGKAPAKSVKDVEAPTSKIKEEVKTPKNSAKKVEFSTPRIKEESKVPAKSVKEVEAPTSRIKEEVKTPKSRAKKVEVPTPRTKEEGKAPVKSVKEVKAPGQSIKEVQTSALSVIVPTQGDVQKLIAVQKDQVLCLDVATSQWQQLIALRQNIQVDSLTSSTFIPPNWVLVCGGGSWDNPCTRHADDSAYLLDGDGSVQDLPHMSTGRYAPGIAWDSVRHALYVFGGGNAGICYTGLLRTSEMFLSVWSPLPDMYQARDCFNTCWHSSVVYLCGGFTDSVETYDPLSNTFTLQGFTLPEWDSDITTVVEGEKLTVISRNYISKLQQGKIVSQEHESCNVWSNCTPLVTGGVIYVVRIDGNCCRCIDSTTGAVQKEVRLS